MAVVTITDVHQCAAVACRELIDVRLLFCRDHWSNVPQYLRDELRLHFRFGQEHGKVKASVAWLNAADQAIAAVADREAAA